MDLNAAVIKGIVKTFANEKAADCRQSMLILADYEMLLRLFVHIVHPSRFRTSHGKIQIATGRNANTSTSIRESESHERKGPAVATRPLLGVVGVANQNTGSWHDHVVNKRNRRGVVADVDMT